MSLIDRRGNARASVRLGSIVLVVLCVSLLQACGGSGSNALSTSDASTPPASTGTTPPVGNSTPSTTGSATLSWSPPATREDGSALTDLSGFKVYYGTSPDNLSSTVTLNGAGLTSYEIDNLSAGTYYFVVTAIDSSGAESPSSTMVSKTI
jgi:hypothetical protein